MKGKEELLCYSPSFISCLLLYTTSAASFTRESLVPSGCSDRLVCRTAFHSFSFTALLYISCHVSEVRSVINILVLMVP